MDGHLIARHVVIVGGVFAGAARVSTEQPDRPGRG
jgi:hypothetical protein